jgi:hypothetical protein
MDDQFMASGLLDGNVSGPGALQDLVDKIAVTARLLLKVRAIAGKNASAMLLRYGGRNPRLMF